MAETLALLEKRGETALPVLLAAGLSNDLLKAIFNFVRQINEIEEHDDWMSAQADPEPKVIFQTTLHGFRFTLLCSPHQPANKTEQILLSPREQEIVRLAARGMSNKTIAAVLEISPWTVSTYIRRIFTKLNVNSRVEMVAIVTKSGFLPTNETQNNAQIPTAFDFEKLIGESAVS